jgi:glycosyltransferase involved in cell wall biosynthesis
MYSARKAVEPIKPLLSLIIPARNEEERLPATLMQIAAFIESQEKFAAEVIVVDSASSDATRKIVMEYGARYPFIKYLHEKTVGKGAAVRTGMLAGQGDYLLACDADLAVPIDGAGKFLPPQLPDCDIAIGSRQAEGARRYNEPFHRHLMGRVFNLIVRLLLLPGLHDTQCGFKCFRRDVAHDLFSLSKINGWSFDVEILYMARLKGYRIVEVPVDWYYGERSKVNPVKDTWHMLREVLVIRRNSRKGLYRQ